MNAAAAIPMLICGDPSAEITFCTRAFGATEVSRRSAPDGSVTHATLKIGGAMIMVHSEVAHLTSRRPQPDASSPVVVYLLVENADMAFAQATAAGGRVVLPLKDEQWGYRVGRIIDPAGHVWNLAAPVGKAPNKAPEPTTTAHL